MIYVLYSDDYEVFLGGNYLPEREVLIAPTNSLMTACEDAGIPITLFVDVCCLWRYKELGQNDFPQAVEAQLCDAIQKGHDVQLHVHPHWAATNIERNGQGVARYRYDLSRFLLGNWTTEPNGQLRHFARTLFEQAKNYLESLLRPVDSSYCCLAYRAGGYGIQPETAAIMAALEDAGYLIDSSVVPGMRLESNVNHIDFSHAPEIGNYRLSTQRDMAVSTNNGPFEIPIATGILPRTAKLYSWASLLRTDRLKQPRGYPIQSTAPTHKSTSMARRLLRAPFRWPRSWAALELCSSAHNMFDITRRYIDKYDTKQDLFFSFSCHSKGICGQTLNAMTKYQRKLTHYYGSSLSAITFQEAAARLASTNKDSMDE